VAHMFGCHNRLYYEYEYVVSEKLFMDLTESLLILHNEFTNDLWIVKFSEYVHLKLLKNCAFLVYLTSL
jgi:hypothetical protein